MLDTQGINTKVEPGSGRRSGDPPGPADAGTPVDADSTAAQGAPATPVGAADTEAPSPASVRDLERAIVAATLAGRHATAELLADRLRERLAGEHVNVVRLGEERQRQR